MSDWKRLLVTRRAVDSSVQSRTLTTSAQSLTDVTEVVADDGGFNRTQGVQGLNLHRHELDRSGQSETGRRRLSPLAVHVPHQLSRLVST